MGRGLGSARFRDQVVGLGCLWEAWTEAEQVVVVYSLIRRLPPVPARFLLNLLTHAAANDPAHDLSHAEATANDPAWVSQLADGKDSSAADLLHHLPLLRPSNTEAKMQYLSLIPKVLAQAVTSAGSQQSAALENARQLLSYTLIHPAVTVEERRALTHWLRALEERLADHRRHPQPPPPPHTLSHTYTHLREGFPSSTTTATTTTTTTTTTTNSSSSSNNTSTNNSSSSSSHTQSHTSTGTSLGLSKSRWTSDTTVMLPPDTGQDDVGWCSSGGVSTGLGGGPPGEAPQSPNNSATSSRSSGCESNPEEACQPHPGMRDVGVWLKSLRLHKYSPLLCNLAYEELLALDEATLEAQGVTKGARHKIVLSINKLKERQTQLVQIEKEVVNGGHLLSCLNEMKAIILTPFPPYNPPADASPHPHHHHHHSQQQQHLADSSVLDSTTTNTSSATTTAPTSSSSSTIVPASLPSTITAAASSTTSSLSTSNSSSMCSLRGEERELLKEDAPRSSSLESENSTTIADNDLPSQFTRVMGKVCTQLLVSVRLEDECVSAFLGLVEKCVSHEAFTPTQIRRLQSWKQQIIRVWHPLPPKTKDTRHNRRWSQQYSGDSFLGGSFRVPRVGGQRHPHLPAGLLVGGKAFSPHQPHQLFPLPPAAAAAAAASLGGLMSPRNSLPGLPSLGVGGLLSPQQFLAKRPSLQETPSELRPHITLQRTRSAPSRPHQLPLSGPSRPGPIPPPPPTTAPSTSLALGCSGCGDLRLPGGSSTVLEPHFSPQASYSHLGPPPSSPDQADNDITDRLESLCLSVTEHALG